MECAVFIKGGLWGNGAGPSYLTCVEKYIFGGPTGPWHSDTAAEVSQ